jgi:hypothetical protein
MEHTIKRGKTVIGTIILPSESGAVALGREVFATSAFPGVDPDGSGDQFESYDRAERYLNLVYEVHCEENGIVPEPRPAPEPEIDEEAAYYAREAALEAAEIRFHEESSEAPVEAAVAQQEPSTAKPELAPVADDEEIDDLPF